MSVDTKQKIRYTNKQLELIKANFADRHEVLYALRKHMLQIPLDKQEKKYIDSINKDMWDVLEIGFLPKIEGEMPLNQEVDLWMIANISEMTVEQAYPHIEARNLMEKYLEGVLDGSNEFEFKRLKKTDDKLQSYINIIAKQLIFAHIESQLEMLRTLAGTKAETVEETMKRLQKNSNQ